MCAILGVLNSNINNDLFKKMLDLMNNRGKDSTGYYFNDKVSLGHKRLAIRDLRNGFQPMFYKNYVIIYNGEIYNTEEIKNDLLNKGYSFNTTCDTEIILKGYAEYKRKILKKLEGIFAFAIYNKKTKEIFLARDRLGVKPLFYSKVKKQFIFSSMISPILKSNIVNPILTKKELAELLSLGPSRKSGNGIFKDIKELRPAHFLIYKKGHIKIKRYWNIKSRKCNDTFEEAKDKIYNLLSSSIKRQMASDRPIATLLSGGLDSSIITAITAINSKNNITTYSIDYEDNDKYFKKNNFTVSEDKHYIDIMRKNFNTNHNYKTITQKDVVKLLEDTLYLRDYPGMTDIDSSLYWFSKEIAKEHKVILSGECADEIFGGYPWFYKKELNNLFPWINNVEYRQKLINPNIKINLKKTIKKEYKRIIKELPRKDRKNKYKRLFYINMTYFMTTLLDRKDRMTMGATIEARVPFADTKLIEYLWNLPFNYKYKDGCEKYILKEAFKDIIPKEILNRKKNPYPKTHHPYFLNEVKRLLKERLNNGNLERIFNISEINKLLESNDDYNIPWFGQLMTKPQLIAYLYQFDLWIEKYNIQIKL